MGRTERELEEMSREEFLQVVSPTPGERIDDLVNHPPHYKAGGIETLDFIRAKLSKEGFEAFCQGNVLKYVARARFKGAELQDLKKAQFYLNRAIESLEGDYDGVPQPDRG